MPEAKGPSLQDWLEEIPNLVEHFRNDTLAPHGKDRAGLSPVPMEFTNWREEQKGWRESIALFDQSHHMPETFLSGPDAKRLLSKIGINSLEKFAPMKAKQFIGCNTKGQVIGECVLECLEEDSFELISGMHLQNWIQYNAEVGGYDVKLVRDHPTSMNPNRTRFRFGMDGPNAEALFREVVESDPGEIKFFNMARVRIAGCDVLALRHGMAGHKGVELSGDYADGPKVRDYLLEAGKKYGIRRGGMKTYYSTLGETGWVGYPTPAIYTDPALEDFRRWLPADGWETCTQIGGSFVSDNLEDYYVTPWDLGVDKLMKFDHDFIGREALEAMVDQPHRRKVTLVWNQEDIGKIYSSLMDPDALPYKYMELPMASYAFQMNDEVRSLDGKIVGVSNFIGYTVNEKEFLSVAFVEQDFAEPGTEVTVTWGEPDGGTRKPSVERHRQLKVRARVEASPYATAARLYKNSRLALTA